MEYLKIEDVFHSFDEREEYIKQQLAHFESQATTPQGRRVYADLLRAFTEERRQMQLRRELLAPLLQSEQKPGTKARLVERGAQKSTKKRRSTVKYGESRVE